VLDAGCRLAPTYSVGTEVAEAGGDGNIVYLDLIRADGDELVYPDAAHALGVIMLLLAGDLAGVTPGTIPVFDK
jgi:hypothetical protein